MSDATQNSYTLVDLCIVACAEAFRGDGEIMASGMGLVPRLGAGLAKLTFSPDLVMTDSECVIVREPVPVGPRGDYQLQPEGWMPFRKVFDTLWTGKRHAMTMPTQVDRLGYSNISCIGDYANPKVALLGVRGIPGNTINHPCSYFVQQHSARVIVEKVDMASSVGYDPARWTDGRNDKLFELRRCISNLAVMDFQGPAHAMRIVSVHPGVTVEQVQEQTAFELALADDVTETRVPTAEELDLIDRALDPHGLRKSVYKDA